jgi:putative ABC transport system ATP-binding protein
MIDLINVTKKYNSFPALSGLSLSIKTGEFIAITGSSGSGKSTLMNIIGTLDRPTAGNVFIDGLDLKSVSKRSLAVFRNKKIGFVFQNYNLIDNLTVYKNIELVLIYAGVAPSEREYSVKKALYEVSLSNKEKAYPYELSGGQKQRIGLARAIVNNPKIILADEPSGNLDPENSKKIMGLLKDLNLKGQTVVMVTHDTETTKYSDRVIAIKNGKTA